VPPVKPTDGKGGGGGGGEEPNHATKESLVLYKSFNTLCLLVIECSSPAVQVAEVAVIQEPTTVFQAIIFPVVLALIFVLTLHEFIRFLTNPVRCSIFSHFYHVQHLISLALIFFFIATLFNILIV
jgi:hypothetical protein